MTLAVTPHSPSRSERRSHRAGRLPRGWGDRRDQAGRQAGPDRGRQRRPVRRSGGRLHHEQGEGRSRALVPAGPDRRQAEGSRPQLGRRQRVHRARGLPGHPCDRRRARGGPAGRRGRDRRLLHRADRRAAPDGEADPGDLPVRRRAGIDCGARSRRGDRGDDDRQRAEAGGAAAPGRLEHRRLRQGRRHVRAEHGDHALGHHHRRGRSISRSSTTHCGTRSARPSTGSTSTAVRRPTTRCCCSARAPPASTVAPDEFEAALTALAADLVKQLQADAEGVTKHVSITVQGAATEAEAVAAAKVVAEDNLCKTAFFASDPNWGRIAMAVGNAPTAFDPALLDITAQRRRDLRCRWQGGRPVRGRPERPRDRRGDRPARGLRLGDRADHRPVARVRRRELGVLLMTLIPDDPGVRGREGRGADRGAAVAEGVPRQDDRGQVRRQRDGGRRAEAGVRLRHRVPAALRGPGRRRARWRPADQRRCSAGSASTASSGAGCG